MNVPTIPGYRYGDSGLAPSPIDVQELKLIQASLLMTDDDIAALRRSRAILETQTDAILDVWYGFVGSQPQLLHSFTTKSGEPNGDYLTKVRARFGKWIADTTEANYDATWLAWQAEIGRRHHRTGKNETDGAEDAPPIVPFRYLVALVYPVTATLRPFLEKGAASETELNAMHEAWKKSVLLQVILWSHPYIHDGDF